MTMGKKMIKVQNGVTPKDTTTEGHLMIITAAYIATAFALVNTTRDRLSSVQKRGLTALLLAATGGCCAICGDMINTAAGAKDPKRFALSHLVPACWFPGERAGWVSGNLFAGCGRCNDRTGDRNLSAALPLFAFPEAVIVWTPSAAYAAGKSIAPATGQDDGHDALWNKIDALIG